MTVKLDIFISNVPGREKWVRNSKFIEDTKWKT